MDKEAVFQLALEKVDSGANVSLFIPYDDGVFYGTRNFNGVQVATPVRVYLDVRNFRGRGGEAAQVLLDQVIRPAW
ncbi:MAG: type IV toxin-antitoxin system AbiEi family antitoxin [Desulfatiglandaceae bacterium]